MKLIGRDVARGDMRPPRSRQVPIFQDERRKDTFRQKPWCPSAFPLGPPA
jgi:hypothetical protein